MHNFTIAPLHLSKSASTKYKIHSCESSMCQIVFQNICTTQGCHEAINENLLQIQRLLLHKIYLHIWTKHNNKVNSSCYTKAFFKSPTISSLNKLVNKKIMEYILMQHVQFTSHYVTFEKISYFFKTAMDLWQKDLGLWEQYCYWRKSDGKYSIHLHQMSLKM